MSRKYRWAYEKHTGGEKHRFARLRKWMFQKSVLKKLIASYLLLLILLVVSNVFVYQKTKDLLVSKEVAYNRMSLDYAREIMDQNIQRIYDSCVTFLRDQNVQRRLADIDFIGNQNYLIDELLEFTQENSLIEHAVLYNPALEYILYEEGSLSMNDAFKTYFQYEDWPKEHLLEQFEKAAIGYIPRSDVRMTSSHGVDSDSFITIYFSSRYVTGDNKLLLMIPESRLRKLFKNVYSGNQFMIISEAGERIVNPEDFEQSEELIQQLLNSGKQLEDSYFSWENFLVIHEKSEIFDWTYGVLINFEDILQDVNVIRNVIIWLLAALTFTTILVVVISVCSNYLPLQELMNSVGAEDRDSRENEYDKIRHGIRNLQEDNQMYRENQALHDLVHRGGSETELETFFPAQYVLSVLLTGKDTELAEEIKSRLETVIGQSRFQAKLLVSSKTEAYLIFNDEKLSQERMEEELLCIFKEHPVRLMAGVGTVEIVENLKNSCENAKKAVKQGQISEPYGVYRLQEGDAEPYVKFPIDFESRMMSYIYGSDRKGMVDFLNEVLGQNRDISWSSMDKLLMDFYEAYKRMVSKTEMEPDEQKWMEIFSLHYELEAFKMKLREVFSSLVFESPVDKRAEYVGRYVKDYVKEHYMDSGITIEEIAGKLNLVSTYVSTLFKKEANISFSQYLSDYRIQKAQELLEQTDMKVKDVAAQTGFGTYNNFARVFKKKLGITPVEYKNQQE